jgi:hypothetical protein
MPEQFVTVLIYTGIALGVMIFWGITIGIVYLDINRRDLVGKEQVIWIAVVFLLPLVGFFIYLTVRVLGRYFQPAQVEGAEAGHDFTMLKPLPQSVVRLPTIPASDLQTHAGQLDPRQDIVFFVIEGPHAGERFIDCRWPVTIGRGSRVKIRLDKDGSISRRQAEIYEYAGSIHIRDLNSSHGTRVNGSPIDECEIIIGDKIKVGSSVIIMESDQEENERKVLRGPVEG